MSWEIRALTLSPLTAALLGSPVTVSAAGRPAFAQKWLTMGWEADYRGSIAIHAAAMDARECAREIRSMAQLREVSRTIVRMYALAADADEVARDIEHYIRWLPRRQIICVGELAGCALITEELRAKQTPRELALSDWTPGRYAWRIVKRRPIVPVTINGGQGLWRWR